MNANLVLRGIAVFALAFGLLTIFSGGKVIFGDAAAREAAGAYVPFVVWFNFIAGFAYAAAAIGLLASKPWAVPLALMIAIATAVVFLAFGVLVLSGWEYEVRTVVAMAFRTAVWIGIAWFARRP